MLLYGSADLTARKNQLCLTSPTTLKYLEHKSQKKNNQRYMSTFGQATVEETAADQLLDFCFYLFGITALECKTAGNL